MIIDNKLLFPITLFAFGVIVGQYLSSYSSSSASTLRKTEFDNVWCLGVTVKFPSEALKKEFIEAFAPLAEYVRTSELNTVSYELLQSDKDPMQIYILERYKTKEVDYIEIHRKSRPFLDFREKVTQMQSKGVILDGHSYYETGIGFI